MDEAGVIARAELMRALALSAGELARAGFARQAVARTVTMKGPQDFLTETDAAVEAHLRAGIAAAFPGDGFVGEETGGAEADVTWVVDPIDGTANFARGLPHYCVAIALVAGSTVELGAIYQPTLDELYFARRGHGVVRNGVPVRVAGTAGMEAATVELGWSPRAPRQQYVETFGALLAMGASVRRGASGALGLAYVADGRSDGYAEVWMNAWDCLAGLLMVEEAGGRVGRFFDRASLATPGPVIAAAPGVAAALSAATGIPLGA